jgi:hypothetical protein
MFHHVHNEMIIFLYRNWQTGNSDELVYVESHYVTQSNYTEQSPHLCLVIKLWTTLKGKI